MTPERFSKLKAILAERQPDLTVLADNVHKSHNLSAVLRTCDAVGIHRIHAVSPDGEVRHHHMMSGGSMRWLDVVVHEAAAPAVAALEAEGWQLAVAHSGAGAIDYRELDYTARVAIALGAELHGPSETTLAAADVTIGIPMHGMVESLNVSVAAAVILFEAERQRRAAGLYETSRLDPAEAARTLFEWAYPEIAARCRDRGLRYPRLDGDGNLLENPLAATCGVPSADGS